MSVDKEAAAAERLRDNAERCRRLARQVNDREVTIKLNDLARELEARADAEEQKSR
ncbi:MAG TPA: hypothetical protein VHU15_13185 [Stellaceae bacterium]|jgi:hypothetical protein|nr:hypothetical protein [Stellaceae bacterium]